MLLTLTPRRAVARLTLAAILACLSASAGAQEGELVTGGIMGTVRDSAGQALIGVRVMIPGSSLLIETNDSGQFHLAKVRPGMLALRFRRLGYQPDTVSLLVLAGRTVPLEVTLARLAQQLTPVVISGRADLTGWRRDFYQRRDVGGGHYFTRADIEKRNPSNLTDMLRTIPGVTIQPSQGIIRNQVRFRNARNCAPLTWLDGSPLSSGEFDLDAITPGSVEAVEIYTGSTVPPRFSVAPGIGPRTCGTIIIWSREGQRARPKRNAAVVSPAAELATLVEKRQIYTAAQVDVTARQDSLHPVRPVYPDALLKAQVSGSVMVEFIVDPMGEVDVERLSVVFATHPAFIDAVRDALETASYVPALRGGYPVYQVVQHEFRFHPDTARNR